jgi:gluconokinase
VIAVVMGVSGSGKTTIGEALACRLGWRFIDADDHQPPENVAKMAAGQPLDDADRWPWLDRLNAILRSEDNAVLACSALKERYRQRLAQDVPDLAWIYLKGDFDLIHSRLGERRHRYMPASLLASQFAALEPPGNAIVVDIAVTPAACVAALVARLRQR